MVLTDAPSNVADSKITVVVIVLNFTVKSAHNTCNSNSSAAVCSYKVVSEVSVTVLFIKNLSL